MRYWLSNQVGRSPRSTVSSHTMLGRQISFSLWGLKSCQHHIAWKQNRFKHKEILSFFHQKRKYFFHVCTNREGHIEQALLVVPCCFGVGVEWGIYHNTQMHSVVVSWPFICLIKNDSITTSLTKMFTFLRDPSVKALRVHREVCDYELYWSWTRFTKVFRCPAT